MWSMLWSVRSPGWGYRLAVPVSLPSLPRLAIYASTIAAFAMVVCVLLGIAR
jgi:hypothetical protein